MGLIMITNCRTEAWKLPQLSVKALQLAIHFTPKNEAAAAAVPKGGQAHATDADESNDVDE